MNLLNLLHRMPKPPKRCPRGVPEASQGGAAPHLLKQGQLQLAGASFRDKCQLCRFKCTLAKIAFKAAQLLDKLNYVKSGRGFTVLQQVQRTALLTKALSRKA